MIFGRLRASCVATESMRARLYHRPALRVFSVGAKLVLRMPLPGVLHVIGGHDRGKRFDLNLPEVRIGRGADQDVVLSDIAVSRRHVTVHAENGRYRIKDLGSG